MMNNFRYTNEKCPVCGGVFTDTDDIVVCPLCGTPHHRGCYKKNGECGNSEKHNEGFVWQPEAQPAPAEQPVEQNPQVNAYPYPNANPYANANQQMPPYGAPVQPQVVYPVQNPLNAFPPEIEDGVSTADASAFVRKKSQSYLHKFFKAKSGKRTFNIAAFFFGGYWFIYRKMYKLGIIFLALTLALSIVPRLVPQYARLQNELTEISDEYTNIALDPDDPMSTVNEMYAKVFEAVKKYPAGISVSVISNIAEFALAIYLGLIADKKYKEHVQNKIKSIRSDGSSAGNEEFCRMRILSEGGTTFGFAILAAVAVTFINAELIPLLSTFIK